MNDSVIKIDETAGIPPADYLKSVQIGELLNRHYPGYQWAVNCDHYQGVVRIRNMSLSGNYGFTLKLSDQYSASAFDHDVVMAGGEILERYKLDARAMNSKYDDLAVDFKGDLAVQL